jgi:hypothetical protein
VFQRAYGAKTDSFIECSPVHRFSEREFTACRAEHFPVGLLSFSSVTMNLDAQAVTDIKRSAQSKVARLVFKSERIS